ncbi:MAG: zinc ABC transporter substrate-binding protein [Bacteroidales bacterium]|nr:zinc ABC transporter substrate-binding protein [Bacteroidales bacterium]
MKKLLVFLFIPIFFVTGCKTKQAEDPKPIVTVTILPLQYFAEQLAGDRFRVNVMVPPGVSHHNYDPNPRQLQELEKSKALFINGHLGFEQAWVPKMKSNYPGLPVIDLSSGINLITSEGSEGEHAHESEPDGHSHEGVDPHYWMSLTEARKIAKNMASGLIKADPSCRQMVEANLLKLNTRIDSLAATMSTRFSGLNHRSFLIFHPALAYFARDYHLIQHSMENGGKEPTASHFRELVDLAATEKINTIFIQKEYDQENAQALSREIGAVITVIDPMSPDWFAEMEQLATKISEMDRR